MLKSTRDLGSKQVYIPIAYNITLRCHEGDGMWNYSSRVSIREALIRTAIQTYSSLEETESSPLRVDVPDLSSYMCSIEESCVCSRYVVRLLSLSLLLLNRTYGR